MPEEQLYPLGGEEDYQFANFSVRVLLARFQRHEVLTVGSMDFIERELEG